MTMNPNATMANMNAMAGPMVGAPMPLMNNGAGNLQAGAAAAARQQQMNDNQRGVLNTYIYEYFIRYGMYDCARSLLSSDQQVNVDADGVNRRRDDAGNAVNGIGDDPMETDTKDDLDAKLPEDLPPPKIPMPASDTSFLYEWFCLFWDIYNAQRAKGGNGTVNQYVAHTQQQELFRQMRPDMAQQQQQQQYQAQMMRSMQQNGGVGLAMKQNNLARAAMANNQNNPQIQMLQAKQNQMQRDPSGMDGSRDRPSSPASGDNAPSPSAKRPRLEGVPFNPNQAGGMMPNGNPVPGMPGQPMTGNPNVAAAHQMLVANGINPNSLTAAQLTHFINSPQAARQKSITTYSQNLQQHHGSQMGNKQMSNPVAPQNQGSPMVPQGPDGTALNAFYNAGDISNSAAIRAGPGGAQATAGSNHALQDYQMQLMLLEQQNKKRLMMARQEQDNMGGMPRDGQQGPGAPAGPAGPNGQPFPDASPQAMRTGASPNPAEQAKRGTPQMNNSGIPSPVPEGGQSRDSPNPTMNFMGNVVDPNMAPHFFKGMEGNMAATQGQMNGMRPPSSHPGAPFNNPQMMARQQQQGGQGVPQQWGPNGPMLTQGLQQNQQVQGTTQQRSMPPPSAPPGNASNSNNRTTASPQQAAAAPPTPNQTTKPAPKKKNQKEKRTASQKKNQNSANNAAVSENSGDQEVPTPATPMTPANAPFNKNGQNGTQAGNQTGATATPATTAPTAATQPANTMPPQSHSDLSQGNAINMDNFSNMVDFGSMELANPLQSGDVLNDFDFDSFLHDGDGSNEPFDFNGTFPGMEGGEIGAE